MSEEKRKNAIDLARALGFNQADIAANRASQITVRQRQVFREINKSMARLALFCTGFAVVVAIIINVVMHLFHVGSPPQKDFSVPRLMVTMLIPSVILWGITGSIFWHNWRDLRGQARQVTGYVQRKKTMQVDGSALFGFHHHLIIKEVTFQVGEHAYYAFDEAFLYTIYYTPRTKRILSAEILEDTF